MTVFLQLNSAIVANREPNCHIDARAWPSCSMYLVHDRFILFYPSVHTAQIVGTSMGFFQVTC
jgi:hypothetical protein